MAGKEDSQSHDPQRLSPQKWRGIRILEAVFEVNELLVNALTELAHQESASIPIVSENAHGLRLFDEAACRRAARIPLLLVDLHFQDANWWRSGALVGGNRQQPDAEASQLPAALAAELTRESLMVAWLAVQQLRVSSILLFGMSAGVADVLGSLTPRQLSRIAEKSSHALRIRCQTHPNFWRHLVNAGISGSEAAMCEARLLGIQMLGGALILLLKSKWIGG